MTSDIASLIRYDIQNYYTNLLLFTAFILTGIVLYFIRIKYVNSAVDVNDIQSMINEWWDRDYNNYNSQSRTNNLPNQQLRNDNWIAEVNALRFLLFWSILGPPPLSREQINRISMIKITQNHVNQKLQCTICMNEFNFGENVRKLICDHYFHDHCVRGWLQRHATCPNCRRVLIDMRNQWMDHRIQLNGDETSPTLGWAPPERDSE